MIVGALSDQAAQAAMIAAGATQMTDQFKAVGLHETMFVVPLSLLFSGLALLMAARTFLGDAASMRRSLAAA